MKIKAIIFGATGMVGSSTLHVCLEREDVESVLVVGRRSCGVQHAKLTEVLHDDFSDYSKLEEQFKGYNACFFALGISSMGLTEEQYSTITYDFAVAAGETLARINPDMTFCFVSGMGTDANGRQMWARVKGRTENKLMTMGFKGVYCFRPGYIQPNAVTSNVPTIVKVVAPLFPLWKTILPKYVSTVEQIATAMINSVLKGSEKQVMESHEIVALSGI